MEVAVIVRTDVATTTNVVIFLHETNLEELLPVTRRSSPAVTSHQQVITSSHQSPAGQQVISCCVKQPLISVPVVFGKSLSYRYCSKDRLELSLICVVER